MAMTPTGLRDAIDAAYAAAYPETYGDLPTDARNAVIDGHMPLATALVEYIQNNAEVASGIAVENSMSIEIGATSETGSID